MATNDDRGLVQRALDGGAGAVDLLVRRIAPAIQAEISHLLMRMAAPQGRSPRQELEDLMQDAYLALFERGAKRLAGWDPSRGCTLDSYVRMVARTRALDVLRSRRRTPWLGESADDAETDTTLEAADDHEAVVLAKEQLAAVERHLHELLQPRDYSMFVGLFVEERAPADVAAALGMTPAAVYQWSSRFRRNILPRLVDAVAQAPAPPPEPA